MDVILLVSSATLATRLPLPFHLDRRDEGKKSNHKKQNKNGWKNTIVTTATAWKQHAIVESLFRWTLFLSLCLFSLCTLEIASNNSPFLLFLTRVNHHGEALFHPSSSSLSSFGSIITLHFSSAYKILIAGQCILISLLSPMLVCFICFFPEKKIPKDDDKKLRNNLQCSKMLYWILLFPLKKVFYVCFKLVIKPLFFKKTILKTIPHTISETSVHDKRHNNNRQKTHPSFNKLYSTKAILSWSFGSMIVYFYWVYYLQTTTYHFRLWMTRIWVTHLCSIGVFISSIFDGFGSVSMIYGCVAGFFLEPMDDVTVQTAEQELQFITMKLEEKKKDLQLCLPTMIINGGSNDNDRDSMSHSRCVEWWKSRSRSSVSEKSNDTSANYTLYESKKLQQEVRTLEHLSRDLMDELEDTKYIQTTQSHRWSQIRFWMGTIFSMILSIRLLFACRNLCFVVLPSSSSKNDPITTILLWLVGHHIVNQTKYNSTSQLVSLFLTAFLSFSQIRNFLRILQTVRRKISQKLHWMEQHPDMVVSSTSYPHSRLKLVWGCLQSSLMGCYFLSCVVSIKDNVPIQYQRSFRIALFGDSKMTSSILLDSSLRNQTFVSSAFIATLMVLLSHSIQRKLSVRAKTSEWNHGAFAV